MEFVERVDDRPEPISIALSRVARRGSRVHDRSGGRVDPPTQRQ
jgi:hypothetical protein